MRRLRPAVIAFLSAPVLLPSACGDDSPAGTDQKPKPDAGGGDAALDQDSAPDAGADVAPDGAASLPDFDPTQGSFSDASALGRPVVSVRASSHESSTHSSPGGPTLTASRSRGGRPRSAASRNALGSARRLRSATARLS